MRAIDILNTGKGHDAEARVSMEVRSPMIAIFHAIREKIARLRDGGNLSGAENAL